MPLYLDYKRRNNRPFSMARVALALLLGFCLGLFSPLMVAPAQGVAQALDRGADRGNKGLSGTAAGASSSATLVYKVRFGDHGERTRVVLDMSGDVAFSHFILGNPYRVVVDLKDVEWRTGTGNGAGGGSGGKKSGLVQGYRFGLFEPGKSRLVIDLSAPVEVAKAFIIAGKDGDNSRLVIDLQKTGETAFRSALKKQKEELRAARKAAPPTPLVKGREPGAAQRSAGLPRVPSVEELPGAMKRPEAADKPKAAAKKNGGKRTIILDPGHGGVDPGATGKSGKFEKYLTLAMARELKKMLESTGRYKVVMTRNRDIFLRLRSRLKKARDAGGDLFISLHADSIKSRKTRGLSVYTLSETSSDKEAAALAKSENLADVIAGVDLTNESPEVTNILIDLAQRETMNLSAHYASFLIQALRREVKLLRKSHRFAGFAVLKAPDVPSVLVEMGYLSNKQEERLLRDPKYRAKLGAAIVSATDKYFQWKDRLERS